MSGISEEASEQTVQSVELVFDLVQVIEDAGEIGVSELAEQLDIPTSTAYVHLNTLVSLGYAVRSGEQYRLSHLFLRHGGIVQKQSDVFRASRSYLQELWADVSELYTVALGVHENGWRVLLDRYDGAKSPFRTVAIGEHSHMHNVATGKVLLAGMSEGQVEEIIERRGLPGVTANTITTRDELFDELSDIREQGYAVDRSESAEQQRAVAVPIHDADQHTIGAVSIGGPEPQIDESEIESLVNELEETVALVEITYQR